MPLSSRVALALVLAVFTARPPALHAQGPAHKYAEDRFNVCKSDSAYNRCLDVLVVDRMEVSGVVRLASVSYFELDWRTFESRTLSCRVDPAQIELRHDGRHLRGLSVEVTLVPGSPECAGSWGDWLPEPKTIAITLAASGEYSQESRGQGTARYGASEFQYSETLYFWHVRAAGLADFRDFDNATGYLHTQRRMDVVKAP